MTETMILALFGVAISLLSLAVSAITMWFAWLRRGRLAMTKPTLVFFGHDGKIPKVFLRTLLYSTAQRGKMIERMYVKLIQADREQLFTTWGYAPTTEISPGSGLYVGQTGVSANHHFVLSEYYSGYEFVEGNYTIQVFAQQIGRSGPELLSETRLTLDRHLAWSLGQKRGVLFKLEPDTGTYVGHANNQP